MKTRSGEKPSLYAIVFCIIACCGILLTHCKKFEVSQQVIVKTEGVSEIGIQSCKLAGTLVDVGSTGVSNHGFCWSLTTNHAEAIDCNQLGSEDEKVSFSTMIEGLNPGTTYYFWAYASAEGVRIYGDQGQFTTLNPELPVIETGDVIKITSTSAECQYSILSDGGSALTGRGLCWGTDSLPTLSSSENHTASGDGTGTFTETMTGLKAGTAYYVRAWANNSVGTEYGNQQEFSTLTESSAPIVHTNPVEFIRANSAQVSGSISSDGGSEITEKGFCWGNSPEPTGENASQVVGNGPDPFSLTIEGLKPENHYYVRAFASNANGISYGEDQEFDTPAETGNPVVETTGLEKVTHNSVLVAGSIVSDGGSEVTDKGFCWSSEPDPTFENNDSESAGTGNNPFELTIAELIQDTPYYVRAYAVNINGVYTYGEQLEFRTLTEPLFDARNDHSYKTVRIGEQVWMAENLDIGDMINGVQTGSDDQIIQKYCYDDNTGNCDTYGALYNWYEMMQYATIENAQGVCPEGWHIPGDEDWKVLERTLGIAEADVQMEDWRGEAEGGKLKAEGLDYWDAPNEGASNETGFNALPAGGMTNTGSFSSMGYFTDYWTSTWDGASPWYRLLDADHASIYRGQGNPGYATSVRCIKD